VAGLAAAAAVATAAGKRSIAEEFVWVVGEFAILSAGRQAAQTCRLRRKPRKVKLEEGTYWLGEALLLLVLVLN